jgi:hypothetical protein
MRAALGDLVSNERLKAMAQPHVIGTAANPQQIPFNNLHEHMLSQARTINAALKRTNKETHVSMSQRELTEEEVEDKNPVHEVLEEAEDLVVALVQPKFHQRNGQQ